MAFRRLSFMITSLGFLLWFLAIGPLLGSIQTGVPVLGPILGSSFLRYATSAFGMLLIASGAALLAASFGRAYLRSFIAFSLLIGAPISLLAFNELQIGFAEMIALGETSLPAIMYWALATGFLYGLTGGILGVIICLITRRLWRTKTHQLRRLTSSRRPGR